jgi:hypothetical protein
VNDSVRRLKRKFDRLPAKARAAIVAANAKSADQIAALARTMVPVDDGVLRSTIRVTQNDDVVTVRAGGARTRVKVREGSSEEWDYALGVEFGTAPHRAGGKYEGARHPGAKAQPFFYPSVRANKRALRSRRRRALRKALKDAKAI